MGAYDSASVGVLTENLLCVPVCVPVFSVCVTLFFIPGSDSIRIPYGTKLSLYMSKDAEGTEEFSHNSSSVFAHNVAPLTRTCSQITLSAPRRHVDLNVGWMLSEHYVFPILPPPSSLSWLIKRVIEGDCDWVEVVKSEAREITSIMGKGFLVFQIAAESEDEIQGRYTRVHKRGGERKGGVVYRQEVGSKGGRKRERGKEKTRLPQHDLQNALSPWRLLSALSLRSKVVVQPAASEGEEMHGQGEGKGGRKR